MEGGEIKTGRHYTDPRSFLGLSVETINKVLRDTKSKQVIRASEPARS